MKKAFLWLIIVSMISVFSLAGCEKYPDTEPPPGALPREVTTELDRGTGTREINHALFIPEDGSVGLTVGPKRKDREGWIFVYENGTEIQLNEDVTIGSVTLEAGTKLIKVNKWWCEVFEEEVVPSEAEKVEEEVIEEESPVVQIEVDSKIFNVVNSWDKKIWLFTSKNNPLESFDGIQQKDIAVWGAELWQQVQDLYKALGITETSVELIGTGNQIFSGMENPPRLFITWSSYESHLPGAVRIELKEKKSEK